MRSIKNIIKDTLYQETNSSIEIEDTGFFFDLVDPRDDIKCVKRRLFNFLLLSITVIMCFVAVICSFMFFINDIILFQNKPKMNYAGAITPERSCGREYVLFMFNSADRWAETGIQLHHGDKIRISASGCFNSSVSQVDSLVRTNGKLMYSWTSTHSVDTVGVDSCMYAEPDARFGSVLYQINSEMGCDNDNRNGKIHQISKRNNTEFTTIEETGMLYFSVNDIYLPNGLPDNNQNRDAWFNDNLGEVLMCVEIERKLTAWNWPSQWYRYAERKMDEAWSQPWYYAIPLTVAYAAWSVLRLFGWLGVFIGEVFGKLGVFLGLPLVAYLILRYRYRRKRKNEKS